MKWDTYQNYHREFDGAIFMCNRQTKQECLRRGLFGLPPSHARFVQKIKSGMILFLFEYEERKLFGVFEAASDGGIDIVPDAFRSLGKSLSSQVRIQRVWFCYPLSEPEFYHALKDNYYTSNKFHFCLKKEQVEKLITLFSSKKIKKQVSGDTEIHYRAMDQFKKYGQGVSAMNEDEKSIEEKVSEKKVALTTLNRLRGQGSHSENENNLAPYRTVSALCSDASTTGDFFGGDRSELPLYSSPCLQYLQDPFPSEIEHYSKQTRVEELTKPSIPGNLMLADVHMVVSFSHSPEMGMEISDFSRFESDFNSNVPLACWHGIGLQGLEKVNEVNNDVHYENLAYSSAYTDQNANRTSAFERLSFTPETRVSREKNVDVSANELIELLAERSKRWRVPSHKKERAQHFCEIGMEHQTEKEVEAIVSLEVDDEPFTWFQKVDHGKRQFPNFRRRSDIHKENKDGGTCEEGDLKVDSGHVRKRRKLIRPFSMIPSSVGSVREENTTENQAEAVVGQCALHLLKQNSEYGACDVLQGSVHNVIGPIGCIDQNVGGLELQKPLLQGTGSNSGQLDVPQSSLSVADTSGDQDENRLIRTGCMTQNPIICLAAQPDINYQHLVDSEDDNLGGGSQVIQHESMSIFGDDQVGNQILQAGLLTQNTVLELADQIVIKHGHCVHDGEGDLDELPIEHESISETVEDQSNIMQSKNASQTRSLLQKTEMSLAEQAENENEHLIHGEQVNSEVLPQAIHQEGIAEDIKKDEIDLEQPQNGNQILQDQSYSRNAKVKHGHLVHDGEGDLDELLEPIEHDITLEAVENQSNIVQSKNENQILQTGSLFLKAETSFAEQAENKNKHLINGEQGDSRELSQAIHQEGIAEDIKKDEGDLEQPQNGNHILQDLSYSQNPKVKNGHLVHDAEGDLNEVPEPIEHEITSESIENQSKNENQILQIGSLFLKAGMSLAEQAENQYRHLIHDGQGDLEELSNAIHQESTAQDVKKDEGDLQQPHNGDQILQDESYPRNAKTLSAEHADVMHKGLVHDGEGVMCELSQDTRVESTMLHVQKDQGIQLSHNENQILDTVFLSKEEMITLAEAEIGPGNSS